MKVQKHVTLGEADPDFPFLVMTSTFSSSWNVLQTLGIPRDADQIFWLLNQTCCTELDLCLGGDLCLEERLAGKVKAAKVLGTWRTHACYPGSFWMQDLSTDQGLFLAFLHPTITK